MGPRYTDALVARYMGASSPSADEHSSPERPRSRSAVVSSSSKPGDQARQSAPRATVASLPRASRTGKDDDSSGDELHRPSKTGEPRSSSTAGNQVLPRASNSSAGGSPLKGSAALGERAAQLLAKHHARLQGLVPDPSAAPGAPQGRLSSSGPARRTSLRASDAATGGSSSSSGLAASSLRGSAAAHLQRISEGGSTDPLHRRMSSSAAAAAAAAAAGQGARRASGEPTTTTAPAPAAAAAAPRPPRASSSQLSPSPRPTPHYRPSTTTAAHPRASSSGGAGPAAAGVQGDSSDEDGAAAGGPASKLLKQQQERRGSWQGPASPGSPNLPPPDPLLVKQAAAISRSRAKGQARAAVRAASDDGRVKDSDDSSEGSEGGGKGQRRSRASSSSGEDAALRKVPGYGDGTRRPPPPPPQPAPAAAAEVVAAPAEAAAAPGQRSSAGGAAAAGVQDRQASSGGGAAAAPAASSGGEDLEQDLLWRQVQASSRPQRALSPSSGAGSPRRRGNRYPPGASSPPGSSSRWTPWYQDHVRHLQAAQGRPGGGAAVGGLESDVSFHEWRAAGTRRSGAVEPGTGHKLLRRLLREGLSRGHGSGSSSSSAGDESGEAEEGAGGSRRGRGRLVSSSRRSRDRSRSPGAAAAAAGLTSQRWVKQQAQAALLRASLQAVSAAAGRAPPGEQHHRERVRAVLGDATNAPRATSRGRGGRAGSPLKGRPGSPSKLGGVEDLLPGPPGGSRYGYSHGSSSSAASRGRAAVWAAAAAAGAARSRSSSPVVRPQSAMAGVGLPGGRPPTSSSRPGRYPSAPSYRSISPSSRRAGAAAGGRGRGGLLAELGQLRDARSSRELMPPPRPRSARPVSPPRAARLTGLTDNVSPPRSDFWSTSYLPQAARASSPVTGYRAGTPVSPIHHLGQVLPAEDLVQLVGDKPNISPLRPHPAEGRAPGGTLQQQQQQQREGGAVGGLGREVDGGRGGAESPVQPLLHIPRSLTNVEGRADLQLISSPPRSRPQAAANLAALQHLAAANVLLQPQYAGVRGRRGQDPRRPQLLPVQELEESFAAWKHSRRGAAGAGAAAAGRDSISPDMMLPRQNQRQHQQQQQVFMGWAPGASSGQGSSLYQQQQGFSTSSLVPEPSLDFSLPPLPPAISPPVPATLPHHPYQPRQQQAAAPGLLPSHLRVTEEGDVVLPGQQQAVQKQLSGQRRTEHLERLSQELAAQQALVQQQLDAALRDQVQELQGYGYLAPAAAARSPGNSRPGTAAAARAAVQEPGQQLRGQAAAAAGGAAGREASGELGVSLEAALRSVKDLDDMMGALLVSAAARSPTGHRDSLIASTAAAAAAAAAAAVQEEEQGAAYDGSSFGQQLAAAAAAAEAAVRAVTPARPGSAAAVTAQGPAAAGSGSPAVQRQLFGSTAVSPSNLQQQQQQQQQQAGVGPWGALAVQAAAQRSSWSAPAGGAGAAAAGSSPAGGADASLAVLAKLAAIEAQLQHLQLQQQQQAASSGPPLAGVQPGASPAAATAMGGAGRAPSPSPSGHNPGAGGSPVPSAAAAAAAGGRSMGHSPPTPGASPVAGGPAGAAGGGWSTPTQAPGAAAAAAAAASSTPEMASTRRAVGDLQQLMAQMSHLQASVQGLQMGQGSPALVNKVAALLSSPGPTNGMGKGASGGAGATGSLLGEGAPGTEVSAASLAAATGALLGAGRAASPVLLQQQASAASSSWRSGAVSRSLPIFNLLHPEQQQQTSSWQGVLAAGAAGGGSGGASAALAGGRGTASPLGAIMLGQALQEAQEAQQQQLQERVAPLEQQVWEQGQLLGRLEQVLARQQLQQAEAGPLAAQQHQQLVAAVQEQQQRQQQELGNHALVLGNVQEVVQGLLAQLQALQERQQSSTSSFATMQAQQLALQTKQGSEQQALQQLEQQLAALAATVQQQQQQQRQASGALDTPAAAALTEALQQLEGRVQQLQQQAAQQREALAQEVAQRQAAQLLLQQQGQEDQGQQQQQHQVVLERLAAVEQQQAQQQQRLQEVGDHRGAVEQQVAATQQQLQDQVQSATAAAAAAWQEAQQQQAQRLEEVGAALAAQQEQQQEVGDKLAAQQERQEEAAAALQQASAGVALLQEQLAGLEAKVSQLQLSVLNSEQPGQASSAAAAATTVAGEAGASMLAQQQQQQLQQQQLEGLQQQVLDLQQQLTGVQQQQQQQQQQLAAAAAGASTPEAAPASSEVALAVEALGAKVSALAGQLQEVGTATAVNLPLRLGEVEQRVMSTAQTCADAVKVIAFKHQAISEMFSTMQAAQAGLDSRLQQLEVELGRARAARRSSSRPSSSQEGAAAVPLP